MIIVQHEISDIVIEDKVLSNWLFICNLQSLFQGTERYNSSVNSLSGNKLIQGFLHKWLEASSLPQVIGGEFTV